MHHTGTFVLSLLMFAIGVALIVQVARRPREHALGAAAARRAVRRRRRSGGSTSRCEAGQERREPQATGRPGGRRGAGAGARAERRARAPPGRIARAARPRELAARSRVIARRSIGSPILFTIVYSSLASAIYFSLGVIAGHALGLTPLVFLIAALMFALTAMTYVEGASLHQDRGGSTVFARYAFNELVSFVAGWAILLDYVILIAVTAYSATQYLRVFWIPLGDSGEALALALAFIALVVLEQHPRLQPAPRAARRDPAWPATSRCRRSSSCSAWSLFFDPSTLLDPIHLGSAPTWSNLIFALTVRGDRVHEPRVGLGALGRGPDQPRRAEAPGLEHDRRPSRSCTSASRSSAITALPVHDGHTELATTLRERADDRHRRPGARRTGSGEDAHVPGRRPRDA